jgi:hypothetical protein
MSSLLSQASSYEVNIFTLIGTFFILTHFLILVTFCKEQLLLTFQFSHPAQSFPTQGSNWALQKLESLAYSMYLCFFDFSF